MSGVTQQAGRAGYQRRVAHDHLRNRPTLFAPAPYRRQFELSISFIHGTEVDDIVAGHDFPTPLAMILLHDDYPVCRRQSWDCMGTKAIQFTRFAATGGGRTFSLVAHCPGEIDSTGVGCGTFQPRFLNQKTRDDPTDDLQRRRGPLRDCAAQRTISVGLDRHYP